MRKAIFWWAQREPGLTAAEVREHVIRVAATMTEERRRAIGGAPGLRAFQVIVQKARRRYPLDEPFSLGHEAFASIPSEAVLFLLDMYRTCLVTRTPFSIRHAVWCVRLRALAPENAAWVYALAEKYAYRERLAEAFGHSFDTRDLDADLAFQRDWTKDRARTERAARSSSPLIGIGGRVYKGRGWAHRTAENLGVVPLMETSLPGTTPEEERTAQELFGGRHYGLGTWGGTTPGGAVLEEAIKSHPRYYSEDRPRNELELVGTHSMDQEANLVFALWLGRIKDAEKWASMTVAERIEFAKRLREEVVANQKVKDEVLAPGWYLDHNLWTNWQPEDLLREMGIDPDQERRWWARHEKERQEADERRKKFNEESQARWREERQKQLDQEKGGHGAHP